MFCSSHLLSSHYSRWRLSRTGPVARGAWHSGCEDRRARMPRSSHGGAKQTSLKVFTSAVPSACGNRTCSAQVVATEGLSVFRRSYEVEDIFRFLYDDCGRARARITCRCCPLHVFLAQWMNQVLEDLSAILGTTRGKRFVPVVLTPFSSGSSRA